MLPFCRTTTHLFVLQYLLLPHTKSQLCPSSMASWKNDGRQECGSLHENPAAVEAVISMGFYSEEEALSAYQDLQTDEAGSSSNTRDDVTSGTNHDAGGTRGRAGVTSESLLLALDAKYESRVSDAWSTCEQSWSNQHSRSLEINSLSGLGAGNATATPQTPQANSVTVNNAPTDAQPVHISSVNEEVPAVSTNSSTAGSDGVLNTEESFPVAKNQSREPTRVEMKQRLLVLRKENRLLKERQTCRKCHERPAALTFLPCGHFCFCKDCGLTFTACPLCRRTILADVSTIVS